MFQIARIRIVEPLELVIYFLYLYFPSSISYFNIFSIIGDFFTPIVLLVSAVVDFVLFLAITASNFSNGKFLQVFGFLACFMLMLSISLFSLVWCIFFVAESLPPEKRADKTESLFSIPCKVFQIVKKQRANGRRLELILLMVVDSTVGFTAPVSIQSLLILILLNIPFCWPSAWIGYYRGALFVIMGFGGVFAVKVLPYIMAKPMVIIVACLSSAGYLVAFSLSRVKWSAYVCKLFCSLYKDNFILVYLAA